MAQSDGKQSGIQKLWLFVRKYPTGTKFSSTITKPKADSQAARRPVQPIARRANSANEYTAQHTSATRIFGSTGDIACARGSDDPWTWLAQMPPTVMPIVRNIQPMVTTRPF